MCRPVGVPSNRPAVQVDRDRQTEPGTEHEESADRLGYDIDTGDDDYR